MSLTRRQFLSTAAATTAAASLGTNAYGQISASLGTRRPVVIASGNGVRACDEALQRIRNNESPLDAVIAGVNIVENDPSDQSVGYGGIPNEHGVVELDACCMDGKTHKAGGVAALQNIKNPSSVARLVMQRTDHVLIVGAGALAFAKAHGFKEENLLTDASRKAWLRWKESLSNKDDWLAPEDGEAASRRHPAESAEFTWGTINCLAVNDDGDLAGTTTTSGLSYKIPGRVGDSPIIGAGLYVDNEVGAAGSTGRGEANLQNCSSFMIVELMRQGREPQEACLEMLQRVARKAEPRLRNAAGEPKFQLTFYALRKDGAWGGASMRPRATMSADTGSGARQIKVPSLYS